MEQVGSEASRQADSQAEVKALWLSYQSSDGALVGSEASRQADSQAEVKALWLSYQSSDGAGWE